jgi:hypothetical protein
MVLKSSVYEGDKSKFLVKWNLFSHTVMVLMQMNGVVEVKTGKNGEHIGLEKGHHDLERG